MLCLSYEHNDAERAPDKVSYDGGGSKEVGLCRFRSSQRYASKTRIVVCSVMQFHATGSVDASQACSQQQIEQVTQTETQTRDQPKGDCR